MGPQHARAVGAAAAIAAASHTCLHPPADGTPVLNDFNRIMTTVFNGASNIAQARFFIVCVCVWGGGHAAQMA